MASYMISLGIGSPAAIPEFLLFGLSVNPITNPLTVSAIQLQATYDPDIALTATYQPDIALPAYFEDGD